jgi:hypothetical protein
MTQSYCRSDTLTCLVETILDRESRPRLVRVVTVSNLHKLRSVRLTEEVTENGNGTANVSRSTNIRRTKCG